jgi:hypothetical protein
MQKGGMDVIDCNNHVKSAIKYFGPSCAVNSLIDKYNPIGMYIYLSRAFSWKVIALSGDFHSFCGHFRQIRS